MTENSVQLMLGDCLDLMGSIPDGSVDMVLADLPYGTTACKWDTVIPLEPLWSHYKRVIKRNGAIVLTASQPFTTTLISSNIGMFRYTWVWEKPRANGFLNVQYRPLQAHQDILVFSKAASTYSVRGTMCYNPQMATGKPYFDGRTYTPERPYKFHSTPHKKRVVDNPGVRYPRTVIRTGFDEGAHPTQKPVALMEYLIRTYTNEGETVLDNTMGSGTTGVACINTGRAFIGIEKDAGYFQIAEKRIQEAQQKARQLVMEGVA